MDSLSVGDDGPLRVVIAEGHGLRATPAELEKLAARFGRYDARGRVRRAALQPVAA
jgi:hypothetical protein